MTRAEFLRSKGYWLSTIQLDLYAQIEQYMEENNLNRTQLAEKLGVTKGYVSQVLNGDFDHKISKLVDMALLIGKAPQINYVLLAEYIERDAMKMSENMLNSRMNSKELNRTKFVLNTTENEQITIGTLNLNTPLNQRTA